MINQKHMLIKLTTLEPFRVGGKSNPLSEADNPIALVGGRVCIPGATLKGAYRAELERWLNSEFNRAGKWTHDSLRPCIPSTQLSKDEEQLINDAKYKGKGCAYRGDRSQQEPRVVCPACYLLGAMGLVGFVNVPFLFTDISYEGLYSARLDRVSLASMGGNRPYQLIPPESVFKGTLEILVKDDFLGWELGKPRPLKENPDADSWLLKSNPDAEKSWSSQHILDVMIKERIKAITRLGGYRSKGFGKVRIDVSEL